MLSPADGSTANDQTATFDWSDVPDTGLYLIQIDDNSGFSSPLLSTWPTASTYTISTSLTNGTYYWRVCTRDAMVTLGAFSTAWTLILNDQLLAAPTFLTPTNGSTVNDLTPPPIGVMYPIR